MTALQRCLLYGALLAMASWPTAGCAITDFGRGKPITAQDLSGKTFCWNDGGRVTYGANGLETNNTNNHHPPWSVPEPGVLKYWGNKYTRSNCCRMDGFIFTSIA